MLPWDHRDTRLRSLLLFLGAGVATFVGVFLLSRNDDSERVGTTETTSASLQEEHEKQLATFVLDDAQATWRELFARAGKHYEATQLVTYRQVAPSGCGFGQTATGPFFCPSDDRINLDLSFQDELAKRGAVAGTGTGASAQAYVIAHEIGHHVQKLLGAEALVKSFRLEAAGG